MTSVAVGRLHWDSAVGNADCIEDLKHNFSGRLQEWTEVRRRLYQMNHLLILSLADVSDHKFVGDYANEFVVFRISFQTVWSSKVKQPISIPANTYLVCRLLERPGEKSRGQCGKHFIIALFDSHGNLADDLFRKSKLRRRKSRVFANRLQDPALGNFRKIADPSW